MIKTTLCIILATAFLFAPQTGDCVSGNPVLEGDDAKFNTVTLNADPTPGYIGDDNGTTVETEDWHIWGNASNATTGHETVKVYISSQSDSTDTTWVEIDPETYFKILALDLDLAVGKKYRINGTQITSAALSNDASLAKATGDVYTGTQDHGGANLEISNSAADAALTGAGEIHFNTLDEQISIHSGADGEISGEASISFIQHKMWSFDPDAICDGAVDRLFLMTIGDDAPEGIIIDEWKVSFEADPATEADLDLKRADAFIGVANAAVMDVLDTTSGTSSEDNDTLINSDAAVANAKVMYLEFGTAYTEENHQIIFEIWYHCEED